MSLHKRIHLNSPHYDLLIEELKKFDSGDYGERYIRELIEQEFGDAFIDVRNVFVNDQIATETPQFYYSPKLFQKISPQPPKIKKTIHTFIPKLYNCI